MGEGWITTWILEDEEEKATGLFLLKPCTSHKQRERRLFAQILSDLLNMDPEIAQIEVLLYFLVCARLLG